MREIVHRIGKGKQDSDTLVAWRRWRTPPSNRVTHDLRRGRCWDYRAEAKSVEEYLDHLLLKANEGKAGDDCDWELLKAYE